MTNKVYADGKGPSYAYAPDGKLSQRTWARGIVTDYSYDNWGSLTNTVYSDNTPAVSLAYDALGHQTEASDAAGVTTFLYDSFGSLTNETVIGVAGTNTIIRHWDNFGRSLGYSLVGRVVPNEPHRQSILAYDPETGRLASMQIPSEQSNNPDNQTITQFTWSYHPGSDLKSSLAYPNGLSASWTYDANNQLLQARNATPTNIISQYDYTYDAAGRRINASKTGTAFTQDDSVAYGYNIRSELTNAVAAVDSNYRYAYDFDDIGNRETSFERGTNSVYTANNLNQYISISNFASSAFFAAEFIPQFDDDGNQTLIKTSTGIWSVTYNGENRPTLWTLVNSSTHNSSTPTLISMSYDRMGRRVTKNAQRFVYNGYLQIANFELQTSNLVLQTFIWDPAEPVATRPLAWNRDTFVSYYTHDGNKNVSEVVTGNGETAIHYEFAPFGAVVRFSGVLAGANPWRFSSEYADDALGVVYYNYRYYDPVVGRWMSMDPLSELGGVNLYSMLWNGIVDITDFLGLGEAESSCSDFVIYINPVYGYKDVVAGTSVSAPGAPVPMTKEWGVISSDGVVLVRVCYDSYCDSRGEPHIDNMQVAASDVVGSLDELDISVSGFLPKVVDKRLKKMGVELDLTLSGGWSIEAELGRQETTGDHCVEKSATLRVYFKTIEVVGSFSVGKSFGDTRVSGGGSKKLIAKKELKATKEVNFKFCCCKKVTYEKDKVIETTEGTMVTTER
jgi:RHS repeat-associated protein